MLTAIRQCDDTIRVDLDKKGEFVASIEANREDKIVGPEILIRSPEHVPQILKDPNDARGVFLSGFLSEVRDES
ncbi:MAG: hypothetical protein GWN93_19345 [Deltaproteobacteria bacterium]|nr:hypothetical protein [Deltaproteobacteria bacterium]